MQPSVRHETFQKQHQNQSTESMKSRLYLSILVKYLLSIHLCDNYDDGLSMIVYGVIF